MRRLGLWQIGDATPTQIKKGGVDLEQQLEDWIVRRPEIVQAGLTIVGRQIRLEGGVLDLLAIDPSGRWAVIELKKGKVSRDAVAQVLDYGSCLARMSVEQFREKIETYLKSTGRSLDSILEEREAQEAIEEENRDFVLFVVGLGGIRDWIA